MKNRNHDFPHFVLPLSVISPFASSSSCFTYAFAGYFCLSLSPLYMGSS